jgi:hypothetical protein
LVEVPGNPLGDHTRGQGKEGQKSGDREAATRLLDALLRECLLIFRSVCHGEAGAIDNGDAVPTPQIPLKDAVLGIPDQVLMNGLQPVNGELGPGDTIGSGIIGRDRFVVRGAKSDGLTDGVATGGTGLSDLPKEGPKDKVKGPAAGSGEGLFILLGEAVSGDP